MEFRQVFEVYALIVFIQIIVAYGVIYFLIPRFFNKGYKISFGILLIALILASFFLYSLIRINYLEVRYYDYYLIIMPDYIKLDAIDRLKDFRVMLSKAIMYLTPTCLLLLIGFYQDQKKYLELNEQKKTAELSALKNQLNPHFLFNTLNNLYALSLKKSDKAPEVISKLSDILDYMLYRCNDKYVSLYKEIELIENYIELEKVRYGNRANISFKVDVPEEVKIAPLVLLSFVENAFKHGVSQEINEGTIDIDLKASSDQISFSISNSIPRASEESRAESNSIGLKNVRKQLELIYNDSYNLETKRIEDTYHVQLKVTNT